MNNLRELHQQLEDDMLEWRVNSEPAIKKMQGITKIIEEMNKNKWKVQWWLEIENWQVTLTQFDIEIKKYAD